MFRKIVKAYDSYVGKTSHVFMAIAGIQILLMVLITTYSVVMRYFFAGRSQSHMRFVPYSYCGLLS